MKKKAKKEYCKQMRVEVREKKKIEKIETARKKHAKAAGKATEHRTTAKQSMGTTKEKETKRICEGSGDACSGCEVIHGIKTDPLKAEEWLQCVFNEHEVIFRIEMSYQPLLWLCSFIEML